MSIIKQVLLTIFSVITIFLFFRIEIYNDWFSKIITDEKKNSIALNQLDIETRKRACWGDSYKASKSILDYFRQNKYDEKDAFILFPPNQYLIDKKINFSVPEPAKFYYFTGLKSAWANSPLAERANYVVAVERGEVLIIPVQEKNTLSRYLSEFRKYSITL